MSKAFPTDKDHIVNEMDLFLVTILLTRVRRFAKENL